MPELKDKQLQVVNHNDGNLLVSASAGSGKTFVMIERLIRLILEGKTTINEVLAVTFTESAALDMKEKLKKALIEEINHTKATILYNELNDIASADISTIDSFCAKLVRTYFFIVGVAPDFKIADPADVSVYIDKAIDSTFKEYYDSEDKEFLLLVARHSKKRKDKDFKNLILNLHNFCSSEANPEELLNKGVENCSEENFENLLDLYKDNLDRQLLLITERLVNAYKCFSTLGLNKSKTFCEELMQDVFKLKDAQDIYAVKQFEGYKKDLSFDSKLKDEPKRQKEIVAKCRDEFVDICKRFNLCLTSKKQDLENIKELGAHARKIKEIVIRFGNKFAELKREENLLDFADLEHFALKILQDDKVRETVKNKYKYIFIDEYQDTNGVQEQIFTSIANNNLFMVGDEKQSIYGFRGCRPEFFHEKYNKMSKVDGQTINLNYNFRSSENVINCVNQVFNFSMTEKLYGLDYLKSAQLLAGGIYDSNHKGRAQLHLLVPLKEEKIATTPRVYDILQELQEKTERPKPIAVLVKELINLETTKTYYDIKENKEKPITYKDIAILTRGKKEVFVQNLVKGLIKQGIPVSTSVEEDICSYPEIQNVICILQLIDCFYQDIPLVATMKSAIGKFTDEELAKISKFYGENNKARGNFYNAYFYYLENATDELANKLKDFNQRINELRFIADFVSARYVLEKIVYEYNMLAYLYAEKNGEDKVNRLTAFIDASLNGEKRLSVKEFLTTIEKNGVNVKASGSRDAINLMTIHSSKGLEFPVVIVVGLEKNSNKRDESEEILHSRKYGFAVKTYNEENKTISENIVRGIIKEELKDARLKEELRLFYVALTRAAYSLHMVITGKDTRSENFYYANKFLDYIPASIPINQINEEELIFSGLQNQTRKVLVGKGDEKTIERLNENFNYVYPFTEETTLPLKQSVTTIVKQQGIEEETYKVNQLFTEENSSAKQGIVAHKILEHYNFDGTPITERCLQLVKENILTNEEVALVDLNLLQKAVETNELKSLFGKTLYREKSFVMSIPANEILNVNSTEEVLLQGVLDLLAIDEEKDEAYIIDYKYSALPKDVLKEKYQKQLQLYRYATNKILNKKVVKTCIVALKTGEVVVID